MTSSGSTRRSFLRSSLLAGAGVLILSSRGLRSASPPGSRLNVALVGVGGRGHGHRAALRDENVVALCDVDVNHLAGAAEIFPQARLYDDWRRCLDHPRLEAVVCCTTDHTHAFVAQWAMNRGLHVYLEKPLANTVAEARLLRETYLQNRHRIATQLGTQRHAFDNYRRVHELVRDGAIGALQDVHVWINDAFPRSAGYLPAGGPVPRHLNWDLWLGPAPGDHPFNPEYFGETRPGFNCGRWNKYWDFGTGEVGNWASHLVDLAWQAIDGDLPLTAEGEGDPWHPEVTPEKLVLTFLLPANAWRGPVRLRWHQGGPMPSSPRPYVDLSRMKYGAMFKGSHGVIVSDFQTRLLIPAGDRSDLGYYDRRPPEAMLPSIGHFQRQWLDACKGNLVTSCNFDYSSRIAECLLVGLAAWRHGSKVTYDGAAGRIVSHPQANRHLHRPYRSGWTLNS